MASRNRKLTNAKAEAALRKHAGIVSAAARELGVSRQALHYRLNNSPELRQAVKETEADLLDLGESNVLYHLRRRDPAMSRWYLERRGRARGYGTKFEGEVRLSDGDLEALVQSFGGDATKLRAIRESLASEMPD